MLADYARLALRRPGQGTGSDPSTERERDVVGLALMIVVYGLASSITFEHHLVCQAIPLTVFGMAFLRRPPPAAYRVLLVLAWAVLAMDVERFYHLPLVDCARRWAQCGGASLAQLRLLLALLPVKTYALAALWLCGRKALSA
jgi:hypothetical protein